MNIIITRWAGWLTKVFYSPSLIQSLLVCVWIGLSRTFKFLYANAERLIHSGRTKVRVASLLLLFFIISWL